MVQLVTLNELLPAVFKLLVHDHSSEISRVRVCSATGNQYIEFLGESVGRLPYFARTTAEIVAGTLVYRMPDLGIAFNRLSKIECLV